MTKLVNPAARGTAVATELPMRSSLLDRNALFSDLMRAVGPESPRSVLVLIGFEGLKDYLETERPDAGDALLARLAHRLGETLEDQGNLYIPRRGEFCGLFDGGLAAVRSLLVSVPVELDDEARPLPIRSSLGIALLPDEATDPPYALSLADRRLRALSGNLRPEQE